MGQLKIRFSEQIDTPGEVKWSDKKTVMSLYMLPFVGGWFREKVNLKFCCNCFVQKLEINHHSQSSHRKTMSTLFSAASHIQAWEAILYWIIDCLRGQIGRPHPYSFGHCQNYPIFPCPQYKLFYPNFCKATSWVKMTDLVVTELLQEQQAIPFLVSPKYLNKNV